MAVGKAVASKAFHPTASKSTEISWEPFMVWNDLDLWQEMQSLLAIRTGLKDKEFYRPYREFLWFVTVQEASLLEVSGSRSTSNSVLQVVISHPKQLSLLI